RLVFCSSPRSMGLLSKLAASLFLLPVSAPVPVSAPLFLLPCFCSPDGVLAAANHKQWRADSQTLGQVRQVLYDPPLAFEMRSYLGRNAGGHRHTLDAPRLIGGELIEEPLDMSVERGNVSRQFVG